MKRKEEDFNFFARSLIILNMLKNEQIIKGDDENYLIFSTDHTGCHLFKESELAQLTRLIDVTVDKELDWIMNNSYTNKKKSLKQRFINFFKSRRNK